MSDHLDRMRENFCAAGMLLLAESGRDAVLDHAGMEGGETEVVVLAINVRGYGSLETMRLRERLAAAMREWREDPRGAVSTDQHLDETSPEGLLDESRPDHYPDSVV